MGEQKRKVVSSAIVGNVVEYYDYGLFAVYVTSIGRLFFPGHDQLAQTLSALLVFALGFMARPIGGILFGHIGDKYGRKISLISSIIGMAACTLLTGILPAYDQWGISATILLVLLRVIQGLCVGGEGAATAIFALEHTEGYRPGLIGSICMASNMVGTLLAICCGIITQQFFGDNDMAWRYGFIFGAIMGSIGLYMRSNISETPVFQERKDVIKKFDKLPILSVLRYQWRGVILVLMLGGLTSSVAYTLRGFLKTFFYEFMGYPTNEALYFVFFGMLIMVIFLPLFGMVADNVGYRKFIHFMCGVIIISSIPIYMLLANPSKDAALVLLGVFWLSCMAAAVSAPAYPYAIRSFEVELRFSGVAFSWNIGIAIMGGTAPFISAAICGFLSPTSTGIYIMSIAILYLVVSTLVSSKTDAVEADSSEIDEKQGDGGTSADP